ncbi:MAG: hypothetical protein QOJ85_1580 [Solirubrobacteraceae bacterium]|jgi:hypothetical protein|nr:hypothetical protein [Solirubrobacteraceae bacterium]MEA2241930.1 hypothetical protein [Solirubrobacteraceae bacterium]
MGNMIDRINTDDRLRAVSIDDDASRVLAEFEVVPVLATPAIAAAAGLFTAGLAVEEAADN